MVGFRSILCPVDASDFSREALRYAAAIGVRYLANVTALSVRPALPPPELWLTPQSIPIPDVPRPGERAAAVEALETFVRTAVPHDTPRAVLLDGQVVPEVLRFAHDLPADLIVMGTHGLSGFERFLLGSVTEKVLAKASCPVLTVPQPDAEAGTRDITFGTVVCGVDASVTSRDALAHALSLARKDGGRVVMVHVLEDVSQEEPRFSMHFNTTECWHEIEPEIRAAYEVLVPAENAADVRLETPVGKAHVELLRIASEARADVMVLGTDGRTAPFGSTTQHVLRSARCPVLAVPGRKEQP